MNNIKNNHILYKCNKNIIKREIDIMKEQKTLINSLLKCNISDQKILKKDVAEKTLFVVSFQHI